jgi:hypothetical protein
MLGSLPGNLPQRQIKMPQSYLQRLALLITVNCVRNTVIEDYHADGKLSDAEMKAFNQEVANKIFTFLHYLFEKPREDEEAFLSAMGMMYPSRWDEPKLDTDFVRAVNLWKKMSSSSKPAFGYTQPPGASTYPRRPAKEKKK